MGKNYLRIAWRNLVKDRQFALLNMVGLATGLACAIFIWLWVADEMKMDKYNAKDGQLYQVMQNLKETDGTQTIEYTAGLLAGALSREMPEVEDAATVVPASWFSNKGIIAYGDNRIKAGGQFISKDYYNIFSCSFITGDKDKVTSDLHSVAISDELALKLFHTTDNVVGRTVDWMQDEFSGPYLIVAIFKKAPVNSTERYDLLFNFEQFKKQRPGMESWENSDPSTFLILKKGTDIAKFNDKIRDFEKGKEKDSKKTLFVRKYSDKYLYGNYKDGRQAGGRIAYVRLFSVIAIFILVIACINFMNLSTAKASRRIKEVGIKKVVGASRLSLILQYLGESIFMSFLSLFLAFILILLLLPAFNEITGKTLSLDLDPMMVLSIVGITCITGVIAGSYPALYISAFKPAAVLKGKLKSSAGELWVRKGLVVFQFTMSVIAIAGVMVVYRQTSYIQSKNLGYSRDHIIDFTIPLEMDSVKLAAASVFLQELKNLPGVVNATSYYHNLNGDHGGIGGFSWPGKDPTKDINFANLEVGSGFLETVGIRIREGRNFSPGPAGGHEIIFNESAIREMGLKDPIGKTVKFWDRERQIVGIAQDFNFESLYQSIKPCFFQVYPIMPNMLVKIRAGGESQTIERVRKAYSSFNKGLSFDYRFLDEEYQTLYTSENRVAVLSKYFAGLAILISCLGLFGLTAFTAQKRQKEIGVRKVVGASTARIAVLLSRDFLMLIEISVLVAFPIVWWSMDSWLSGFAYRIKLGYDVFLVSGLVILVITLLTVGVQATKAAMINPVKTLRSE